MSALSLLAFSLFATAQASENSTDACASLIPPALGARIATDLPGFRLPTSDDAGTDRLKGITTQGDWPCPFIVLGDFDGNGWLDRAMLLPARTGDTARLIAALNNQGHWQVNLSEDWPLSLGLSELRPVESGLYQRGDASAQPAAQLDLLASLQADFTGFRAGKSGADYSVYALVDGHWQKLAMPEGP